MPILNYTTTIAADKTVGEIQKMLAVRGATKISMDYEDGQPVNLTFSCKFKDNYVFFSMPCRVSGILKGLAKQSRVPKTTEQALKVGWRQIKMWLEVQFAMTDNEMAELPEIFLASSVTRSGERLYDYLKNDDNILLIN